MVEQRPVRILSQTLPIARRDALGEEVVIISRQTGQRQNLARLRVHHDRHPAWRVHVRLRHRVQQRLLDKLLQFEIKRKVHIVARHRCSLLRNHADHPTDHVLLNDMPALFPSQYILVSRLDTSDTDAIRGRIVA